MLSEGAFVKLGVMESNVDEIADGIYRISTWIDEAVPPEVVSVVVEIEVAVPRSMPAWW
jgi:hypothetical protein